MNPTRSRTGGMALAALALALAPALAAAQEQPQGPGLTLESAVAAARENNPDLLQQKNDSRTARMATRQARADFLPSARASLGYGYTAPGENRVGAAVVQESSTGYYSSTWQLGMSYELSGAKLMQPRIARAQENATERRIEGAEATLVSQVVQQYLTSLQAGEQVQQAEREVARALEHERLAKARLDVGAGTPLDLRRAEVQTGQAQVSLLQKRNDYEAHLLRLGQQMGAPLPAGTRLVSRFQLVEPQWNADELVQQALAANPELLSARANAQAASTSVRAARSAYLPSLSFSVGYRGEMYSASNPDALVQQRLGIFQENFEGCNEQNQVLAAVGLPQKNCSGFDIDDPAVQQSVRQQVAAANPDFPFGYKRQPLSAGLTFSLPLFDGLNRERRIEEARVSQQDARLAVRSQELRLRTEVETALLTLRTSYSTAHLQEQVSQKAAEELRLAQERFRFGAASSVEVTDAQTSLAEAERARIDAIYVYHKSLAALEALVGRALR